MFTLPDANDAATTCPPFKGVGPKPSGFWQDCDPGANFAGTMPIADYFNELIVNLRALLVRAGVAGVKGDQTMLWRAIEQRIQALDIPQVPQQFFQIDSSVTIHVAPGGSASPANPLGGDPFNNLASAWHWLSFYSITSTGYVTIQLATATYTHSAPLVLDHANGERITVLGGDTATTLLYFPSGTNGVVVNRYLAVLSNVTIFGVKTAGKVGLTVNGTLGVYTAYVQGWDTGIIVQNGGFLGFTVLWTNDCVVNGLVIDWAQVNGTQYHAVNIGYFTGTTFGLAVLCTTGGMAYVDQIITSNTRTGIGVTGAGSEIRVRVLSIGTTTVSIAVEANDGGCIIANGGSAGDWAAATGYFVADFFGLIRSDTSFTPAQIATCSPAVNVLGNVNAMITT